MIFPTGRLVVAGLLLLVAAPASAATFSMPVRSLDGSGNNVAHPDWGKARTEYLRIAPARYADGIGAMEDGPPTLAELLRLDAGVPAQGNVFKIAAP